MALVGRRSVCDGGHGTEGHANSQSTEGVEGHIIGTVWPLALVVWVAGTVLRDVDAVWAGPRAPLWLTVGPE